MKNIRKSIVIVGGAGLIGRTFVQACINENISVIVMDIVNEKIWQQLNIGCDLYIQTDINNSTSLTGAIKRVSAQFKVDCVVNASYPRNKNYGKSVQRNHHITNKHCFTLPNGHCLLRIYLLDLGASDAHP